VSTDGDAVDEVLRDTALDELSDVLGGILDELVDDDVDADGAVAVIAAILDAALPLRALLPPPFGAAAEKLDGRGMAVVLNLIARELRPSPDVVERRAERAARAGRFALAARRRERAAMIRARQEVP
jgi:hypothetical protein